MSVIEKLPIQWREQADKIAAYTTAPHGLTWDHGAADALRRSADDLDALMPAIRQDMIDARRWRYLKDECTSHYGDGNSEPKEAHLYLEWGQGPWIRDGSNGGRGRPDVFPGWDAIVDEMMANAASELADLDDAAIDARLASDSATCEGEGHD